MTGDAFDVVVVGGGTVVEDAGASRPAVVTVVSAASSPQAAATRLRTTTTTTSARLAVSMKHSSGKVVDPNNGRSSRDRPTDAASLAPRGRSD